MYTAKVLAALLIGLGALGSTPATTAARDTARATTGNNYHRHYHVEYRHDHHHPWRHYGTYDCFEDAAHAADHLRHRGYETIVR